MATRRPARLAQNRHGTFCLRWIVPKRMRDAQGKPTEVRVSLRTRDLQRARILALEINLAFERMRAMSSQIDPRDLLQQMNMQVGHVKFEIKNEKDLDLLGALLKKNPELKDKFMDALQPKDGIAPAAEDLIRSLAEAIAGGSGRPHANGAVVPVLLTDAIDRFASSRASLAKNLKSTSGEKRRTMDLLLRFLKLEFLKGKGPDPSGMYTHDLRRKQLIDFVTAYSLKEIPQELTTSASPKGNSKGGEESKSKGGRPSRSQESLASGTVSKAIGHLEEFGVYSVASEMLIANPVDDAFHKAVAGLKHGASEDKKNNHYKPFSAANLRQILNPELLLAFNTKADYFWCPLLGLHTAARLGELVTLSINDVRRDDDSGVLTLRIEEREDDGRRVKNKNSIRLVPVSQQLIDIGFEKYVDHIRELGGSMLFPHLKPCATREADPSKNQSRRFADFLNSLEITDRTLVFHSFRHTAVNTMLGRRVPAMDAELIAGHASQNPTLNFERTAGGARRSWSSTQKTTYSHPTEFEEPGERLMTRLKRHIDSALVFDLDYDGLRCAAEIVRQKTTASTVGSKTVFKSGWHANSKVHAREMMEKLKACRSKTAAG